MTKKRVAIIGAGISGIPAVKSCLEEDLEPVCFEQYDSLGGVWYFTDEYRENQGARAFYNLTTNTCKNMFAYSDFPHPDETPVYLTCATVCDYMHSYCDKFGLWKYIQLSTKVTKVRRSPDYEETGSWVVDTENKDGSHSETYDFVILASGFFQKPRYPKVKGFDTFKGEINHSIDFKNAENYKGKRVVVVGNSYSGGDLASITASQAAQVYLGIGRGAYLTGRYGPKGIPYEYTLFKRSNLFNLKKADKMLYDFFNNQFDCVRAGIAPATPPSSSKFMVNDAIQVNLLTGRIKVCGQLTRMGPHEAEFDDGTVVGNLDAILFATGYDRSFPFMVEPLEEEDDKMSLYKMMFPLKFPKNTLGLVGMLALEGAVPPISELQSRIITRVFAGKLQLPPAAEMAKEVEAVNETVLKNFGRYKYMIPYLPYKEELAAFLGVTPSWTDLIKAGPRLIYLYYYTPVFPYHYRLWGPNTWPGAREAIEKAIETGYYVKQPRAAQMCIM